MLFQTPRGARDFIPILHLLGHCSVFEVPPNPADILRHSSGILLTIISGEFSLMPWCDLNIKEVGRSTSSPDTNNHLMCFIQLSRVGK
jgi:hypothetical protein